MSPSRRTMRRSPSCLISCTQSVPTGGSAARVGMQGSMKPLGPADSTIIVARFLNLFGRRSLASAANCGCIYKHGRCEWFQEVEALSGKLPQRIWLDAGAREGEKTIANARLLRDALVAKGWTLGDDLSYFEAADGEHNERSWAARVAPVLEFLFPKS